MKGERLQKQNKYDTIIDVLDLHIIQLKHVIYTHFRKSSFQLVDASVSLIINFKSFQRS